MDAVDDANSNRLCSTDAEDLPVQHACMLAFDFRLPPGRRPDTPPWPFSFPSARYTPCRHWGNVIIFQGRGLEHLRQGDATSVLLELRDFFVRNCTVILKYNHNVTATPSRRDTVNIF